MINSKTQSQLFIKFMKGCEKWMGQLVKQDLGVSIEMHATCDTRNLQRRTGQRDGHQIEKTFCGNLRKDLSNTVGRCIERRRGIYVGGIGVCKRRDDGRKNKMGHVVVPLMGRFKNETGERNLVLVLANETNGGLKLRKWIDRFTALLHGRC